MVTSEFVFRPHVVACVTDRTGGDGLCRLVEKLGFAVRSYESGAALLGDVPPEACCVVCDDRLPDLDGPELQARLREIRPDLPVVFASRSGCLDAAVRVMRNGAVTVLPRPLSPDRLRAALAEALTVHRERRAREERRRDIAARFAALSREEAVTLGLLMEGLPNKTIAARLGVGLRTVERRRASTLETLGVGSVIAAALLRAELGGRPIDASTN